MSRPVLVMDNDQFIEGFEACTLPASEFHHEQHVRIVWLYLRRHSLIETLARFSEGLRRFATANGQPNLYHETITWAYVFLIHQRMQHQPQEQSWPQFVEANADLLAWQDNILRAYYREETLNSETARRTFVFPDRNVAQAASLRPIGSAPRPAETKTLSQSS